MTHKRWTAKERVDIVVEFLSTNIGVAEICRKHGISPTTFDNWRKRFMDAGRRELAGIGGDGGGDPAKALAQENESLKIVAGEQALAVAAMKEALDAQRGERRQSDGCGGGEAGGRQPPDRRAGREGAGPRALPPRLREPHREPCAPNRPRRRADLEERQKGPR